MVEKREAATLDLKVFCFGKWVHITVLGSQSVRLLFDVCNALGMGWVCAHMAFGHGNPMRLQLFQQLFNISD